MASNPPEGLFYAITRRAGLAAGASDDVILAEFLEYHLYGLKDEHGNSLEAENGAITGTTNWLAGYEIYDAKFYVARKPTLLFFASLDVGSDPWTNNPGFSQFVTKLTVDLGQAPITFEPQPKLNEALAARKPAIERVPAADRRDLLAALRGVKGTNLKTLLPELEKKHSIELSDLFAGRLADSEARFSNERNALSRVNEETPAPSVSNSAGPAPTGWSINLLITSSQRSDK